MEYAKDFAIKILNAMGISATSIPESTTPTADLFADIEGEITLIEVKDKGTAKNTIEARNNAASKGEVFDQIDLLAQQNSITSVMRDANHQLQNTLGYPDAFKVIWVHASGLDASMKFKQAFATFYGAVHVFPWMAQNPVVQDCLYFDYAVAPAMPDIEGLVLTNDRGFQFCLNEFSTRLADFRGSRFFKALKDRDAVFDPIAIEAQGRLVRCISAIPRKNDNDVIGELAKLTGVTYQVLRFTSYSASVGVKLDS